MSSKITENKWISLYCQVDDLAKGYFAYCLARTIGAVVQPTRVAGLSLSELCCICAMYHLSGYKCMKYYYESEILGTWRSWFPSAPSYERFVILMPRCLILLMMWSLHTFSKSIATGYYFIDSKPLGVCHPRREYSHKVFKGLASKGKSSMGWFFGFKIHLVINHLGQIMNMKITSGNVADNNVRLLQSILAGLQGKCCGDRGYQTSLFEAFYQQGLHLLVKPKKNMKKVQAPPLIKDAALMRKRGVIESVFDILDNICNIEHTRHRKPENAFCSILGAIIAYQSMPNKPHIFIKDAINYLDYNDLIAA
jgi:hypothetical protein